MKIRIKFRKYGALKFVGHLDMMRYFQKALKRAGIDMKYSEGFNPHMIMSFAAPLGVGVTSTGEYFDMELTSTIPTDEICQRLNNQMADGIRVLSARQVEDGKASKAMSLVAAADYLVEFRPGKAPADGWQTRISEFLKQPEILVTKETKKGEKQVDIRPFIYQMNLQNDNRIFLSLASASANYTKPDAVMDAFTSWLGQELPEFACMIHRLEVYADLGNEKKHKFVSLESLGVEVQ